MCHFGTKAYHFFVQQISNPSTDETQRPGVVYPWHYLYKQRICCSKIQLVRGLAPLIPRQTERMVLMRKRNHRIVFYLNDAEFETLESKVKQTSLSREGFIRNLISDVPIQEKPPADIHKLIWEVRRVGNNIDQILTIANARGLLDVPQLRKAMADLRDVEKLIADTYSAVPVPRRKKKV